MTDFYAKMQGAATRLLDKFHQGTIILLKSGGYTSGANEWDIPTDISPIEYTLNAVATGVSEKYINNDTILATDIEITASAFDDTPSVGDKVIIDNRPLTILQVFAIPSAGLTCAWKIIAR